jgi:excisionase family DNA binding protein
MERQTLSIMKACEAVGVSRRTIYNWISAGKVQYVRTAGGSIRIFADSLWRPSTEAAGGVSRVEGGEPSGPTGSTAEPDQRPTGPLA